MLKQNNAWKVEKNHDIVNKRGDDLAGWTPPQSGKEFTVPWQPHSACSDARNPLVSLFVGENNRSRKIKRIIQSSQDQDRPIFILLFLYLFFTCCVFVLGLFVLVSVSIIHMCKGKM